jgi:hypothetical protein
MAIQTFSDLQASVATWLNRSDLSATIPDFIAIAEANLNRDLDNSRSMETKTTLATVQGVSTVALPTDMLEMKRLQLLASPNAVLKYLSADEIAADYSNGTTGQPAVFAVIGANLELAPVPDSVYSLELAYFQKIPALSNANPTNWLLTAWPDAYLWGSLCAAQPFLMNDSRVPLFEALYKKTVEAINGVDWYSGSTMRVKVK